MEIAAVDSRLKRIFEKIQGYLWAFGLCWLTGLVFLTRWGYEESFLILNALHHPWADLLFPHLTHLGDGLLVSGIFGLLIVRRDKALVICLSLTLLLILILVSLGKGLLFEDWARPVITFQNGPEIHYITLAGERWNSFPSGHSAVAAAVFMYISFYDKGDRKFLYGILWGIVAVVACYSRLYIGVHFLGDILVGSIIGLVSGVIVIRTTYDSLYVYFATMKLAESRRWYYGLSWVIALIWVMNFWKLIQLYLP